jgi:hypothetical protein
MTDRTRKRTRDVLVRATGVLCCTSSYLAVRALVHLRLATPAAAQPGAIAYALAAVAFLCASVGTALVVLGHHVFEEIEVSERWQHRPAPSVPRAHQGIDGADSMSADVEYSAAGGEGGPVPGAAANALDLPLPWRALGWGAHRSTDLRLASQL